MSGGAMFTLSQTAYRFQADNGSESAGTLLGSLSTAYSGSVSSGNLQLALRVRLQESGGAAGATTDDYQLQVSKNGGAFASVTTSSANVKAFASANLTDAGTTTNRLGAGTGSFVAGEISEDGLVDDRQITASNYTEMLYAIEVIAADVADADTLDFRVLFNGATFTYTVTPRITVSKAAAYSGWLPSSLASLKGWYKERPGLDGYTVSTWPDQSGNANDATAGTAPTVKGAFLNSLNVVEFTSASGQFLNLPFALISGLTEGSAFFVIKKKADPPGAGANGAVLGQFGSSTASELYPGTDGHVYSVFLTDTQKDCGDPGDMTGWHLGSFQSKAGDFRYAFNGVDFFTTGTNTTGVAASGDPGPYIGTNGAAFIDTYIAEIFFCSSFLTTADRQKGEGYLAHKWGLTANLDAGHPYKSTPPQDSVTYNDNYSEALTGAFSPACATTFVTTLSESATLADSMPGGLLLSGTVSESVASAYSLASSQTLVGSLTESLTSADSISAVATLAPAISEPVTANATLSVAATFVTQFSEPLTSADALVAAAVFVPTLTEAGTLAASLNAGLVMASALAETATAADGLAFALTINAALSSAVTLGSVFAESTPGAGANITVIFFS